MFALFLAMVCRFSILFVTRPCMSERAMRALAANYHSVPFGAAESSGSLQSIAFFCPSGRAREPATRAENRDWRRDNAMVGRYRHRVPFVHARRIRRPSEKAQGLCEPCPETAIYCHLLPFGAAESSGSLQLITCLYPSASLAPGLRIVSGAGKERLWYAVATGCCLSMPGESANS